MKKTLVILFLLFFSFFFFRTEDRETFIKPRILITNFHSQGSGGHLTFIAALLTSHLQDDFEFAVACPKTSDVYEKCSALGIKTYPCSFPGKFRSFFKMVAATYRLRKIINEYRPDVIHTNAVADRTIALAARLFAKKKPSIIQTFHRSKIVGKDPFHLLVQNYLVNANLFVSNASFRMHQEGGGMTFRQVRVIENGVDLEAFHPRPKDEGLRKELGIPDGYFVFGSSAGLAKYKRMDLMIRALTLFPPEAKLRIIALGGEIPEWMELAKTLGVDHFFCFPGKQKDVRPYCSLFDVGFILSTAVETASFASREMLSMGIPLISSFYSGLKDNVDPYVNGIFVEPGNVKEIYQAMQFFLNLSAQELQVYRGNARLKAKQTFDRQKQIAAIKSLYMDLTRATSRADVPKRPSPT